MNALVLIDLQNDFLSRGAIPVPQGETILPVANQLEGCFKTVVATQDWHPANHRSFASTHPGHEPGETMQVRKQPQFLWPTHCVQKTRGADLTTALMLNRVNRVFRKGTDPDLDAFSGFFDQDHLLATGMLDYFREKKVTGIFVMGLGLEFGVRGTVLDGLSLGFKTWLIEDGVRPFKPDEAAPVFCELKEAGALLVQSRELLEGSKTVRSS